MALSGPWNVTTTKITELVVNYNNDYRRTQSEVLAVFDRAIDLCLEMEVVV